MTHQIAEASEIFLGIRKSIAVSKKEAKNAQNDSILNKLLGEIGRLVA